MLQPVDLDRCLEIAAEMEELRGKIDVGAFPKTELASIDDLLKGVIVDRLEDIGMSDDRFLK